MATIKVCDEINVCLQNAGLFALQYGSLQIGAEHMLYGICGITLFPFSMWFCPYNAAYGLTTSLRVIPQPNVGHHSPLVKHTPPYKNKTKSNSLWKRILPNISIPQ